MRFLLLSLAALSAVSARTTWQDLRDNSQYNYEDFKMEFGAKAPVHSESAFNENLAIIRAHNAKPNTTWKMGVNHFTGMTKKQFKDMIGSGYTAHKAHDKHSAAHNARHIHAQQAPLSAHVPVDQLESAKDWRQSGVVTPVKDQAQCGGCWAFSTSETAESVAAIATGKLIALSEQEILSCTPNPDHCGGSGGCGGATQELGFGYLVQKGAVSEADWPYTASTGTCNWGSRKAQIGFTGFVALPYNNYTALMNAASQNPIAISAAASAWQFYDSGILNSDSDCGTDVNHAIQLVGWGTENGVDYYTIRNSWGAYWGESGYIRIARFGEGKEPCDIDYNPGDGDGCAGGPSQITVCGLCGVLSDSSYPTGAHLLSESAEQ